MKKENRMIGIESMSRKQLVAAIEKKFREGHVLDHTRMRCNRITYKNGDYDSIKGEWLPCLVTNDNDEVAVDYFERGEFVSLTEQVGITSASCYTLDFIRTPYLRHIFNSMIKP